MKDPHKDIICYLSAILIVFGVALYAWHVHFSPLRDENYISHNLKLGVSEKEISDIVGECSEITSSQNSYFPLSIRRRYTSIVINHKINPKGIDKKYPSEEVPHCNIYTCRTKYRIYDEWYHFINPEIDEYYYNFIVYFDKDWCVIGWALHLLP